MENDWILSKSDRNRVNGSLAIKEWLKVQDSRDEQTGQPIKVSDLVIFSTCTTLISHLSQILTDDKDPNCYATQPHDLTHIVDALRYFAIMRTAPSAAKANVIKPSQYNFEEKPKPSPYQVEYSDDYISQF